MSTEAVWSAVADLAEAWVSTPALQALNATAATSRPATSSVAEVLQELDAGGGMVSGQPLALWTGVRFGLSVQDYLAPRTETAEFREFLVLAQRVQVAHETTVAWVRSRLPGYPMLTAPQLARDSAWTTNEWTYRYPWRRADLGAGFQLQARPSTIDQVLGSPSGQASRLTTVLAGALELTPTWESFETNRAALTPADKAQLKTARVDLQSLLTPAAIDRHEPRLALPRCQYREHHTQQAVEAITGRAGNYARSLTAISDLIDLTTVDVLAQLTRFGRPVTLTPAVLELDEAGHGWITADLEDDRDTVFLKPGRLVLLNNSLTPDLVRIEETSFSMQDGNTRVRLRGPMIPGSGSLAIRSTLATPGAWT